jgi:hypothetical protein
MKTAFDAIQSNGLSIIAAKADQIAPLRDQAQKLRERAQEMSKPLNRHHGPTLTAFFRRMPPVWKEEADAKDRAELWENYEKFKADMILKADKFPTPKTPWRYPKFSALEPDVIRERFEAKYHKSIKDLMVHSIIRATLKRWVDRITEDLPAVTLKAGKNVTYLDLTGGHEPAAAALLKASKAETGICAPLFAATKAKNEATRAAERAAEAQRAALEAQAAQKVTEDAEKAKKALLEAQAALKADLDRQMLEAVAREKDPAFMEAKRLRIEAARKAQAESDEALRVEMRSAMARDRQLQEAARAPDPPEPVREVIRTASPPPKPEPKSDPEPPQYDPWSSGPSR